MKLAAGRRNRWVLMGMLLLAIAGTFNVAVAVACALWSPVGPRQTVTSEAHRGWPAPVPEDWPIGDGYAGWSGFGFEYGAAALMEVEGFSSVTPGSLSGTIGTYQAECVRVGWPWRALAATRIGHVRLEGDPMNMPETWPQATWNAALQVEAGWTADPPGSEPARVLPLLPQIGFVSNTLLYAAFLLALVLVHRLVRARWRRRHGCCQRCGYDLGELHACPECGAPRTPR